MVFYNRDRDDWERSRERDWERERDWDRERDWRYEPYRQGDQGREWAERRYGYGPDQGYGYGYGGYNRTYGGQYGRQSGAQSSGRGQSGRYAGGQPAPSRQGEDWDWDDRERYGRGTFGRDYTRNQGWGSQQGRWGGQAGEQAREDWWDVPGPYSGVGPRNYQRSDERIAEAVCERLCLHGQLDVSDVEVDVQDGAVTLTGSVDSRWAKHQLEDVVDDVYGVKDVNNNVRVNERLASGRMRGGRLGSGGMIRPGMMVEDRDGQDVGEVRAVRGNDFLLERRDGQNLYVPFDATDYVSENRVVLMEARGNLDDQGWEMAERMEALGAGRGRR